MKQIARRVIYLLLGMQPALVGTAIMLFALGPLAAIAVAGLLGLTIATAAQFPVSQKLYRLLSVLLICGLVLEVPFFLWALHDLLTGGLTKSLVNTVLVSWVIFGPSACALHALRRSRCTPNNSSKPTPLRGAA
jgi:hypothetical protein